MLFLLLACTGTVDDSSPTKADTDDTSGGGDSADTSDSGGADLVAVTMETSMGTIELALDPEHAPITVENFLVYVDEGFYDGGDGLGPTIFHRVVTGFVIQGGGYTPSGGTKVTHAPIELEANNGLSNLRGTIAMARTNERDSATSQFYINSVDNVALDTSGGGYAVFGTVTAGLDVVDAIDATPVDAESQPLTDVVITSCTR